MRERVKELRATREAERQKVAEEKKRQQFLQSSDKIRTLQSKQEMERIKLAREEQLRIEEMKRQRQQELDAIYSEMWMQDIKAKEDREKRDLAAAKARTDEQYNVLAQQRAALEEAREHERELQQEEQRQMVRGGVGWGRRRARARGS